MTHELVGTKLEHFYKKKFKNNIVVDFHPNVVFLRFYNKFGVQ
jgi:hypothetical protein